MTVFRQSGNKRLRCQSGFYGGVAVWRGARDKQSLLAETHHAECCAFKTSYTAISRLNSGLKQTRTS